MAILVVRLTVPGMTSQELNDRIMGAGLEGKSIFHEVLKDRNRWTVSSDANCGEEIVTFRSLRPIPDKE